LKLDLTIKEQETVMKKNKHEYEMAGILSAQEDVLRFLFVGKTVNRAETMLEEMQSKSYIRVIREDGISYMGTCEVDPNRIKVTVENGIIKEVNGIG